MNRVLILGLAILVVAGLASCQQSRPLEVTGGWARPGFTGGTSAAYFSVNNPADSGDTLTGASSQVAKMVELHLSSMDANGTMRMQQQETVDIPPGVQVEFRPGGLHVMLINLAQDLQPGDTFNLVLTFKNRGNVTIAVEVREP
jgi:periplasmic copper chaperone A